MRLEDCFEKGLLRRRRPDLLKVRRAMEIARMDSDRAKRLMDKEFYMESTLFCYTGMFQGARALLFKDGIFERSHVCVIEYLKEHYVRNHILGVNYLSWLDSMRIDRHEALYGLEVREVSREEAKESLRRASEFVGEIEDRLKEKK
ncbi:MAG: HEPN domain-containing protein [Thermoplasmata archaeon]